MKKKLLLAALLISLAGCQALQNLSDSIRKPTLSVTNVRVTGFNFNEMELTYDVKVNNPNPVALQMLSYDYNFKIDGNNFVKGTQDKKLSIASSGSSTFQIPMHVNFQDLYKLFSGLRGKDEADYKLAANLDFDLPVLGKTTLPLQKSGNLPMVKLPKISVASIKVDNVNFSQANLTLNLDVNNPNGFGLLVNALSYDLNVNGQNWINGNNSNHVTIDKNNESQIAIPISLNVTKIGSSVVQLLNNHSGGLNYELKGNFNFGAAQPLLKSLSTNFSFDKTGNTPLIH